MDAQNSQASLLSTQEMSGGPAGPDLVGLRVGAAVSSTDSHALQDLAQADVMYAGLRPHSPFCAQNRQLGLVSKHSSLCSLRVSPAASPAASAATGSAATAAAKRTVKAMSWEKRPFMLWSGVVMRGTRSWGIMGQWIMELLCLAK